MATKSPNLDAITSELKRLNKTQPLEILLGLATLGDREYHGKYVATCIEFSVIAHSNDPYEALIEALENLHYYLEECRASKVDPVSQVDTVSRRMFKKGEKLESLDNLSMIIGQKIHVRSPQHIAEYLNGLLGSV
jgi:hypothetical protein